MTRAERQKLEDLLTLLALPAGQRFLADLIYGRCGVLRSAALDALALAWHQGRQSVGLELIEAVVNAQKGAVPALLGTFLAEQDRARADLERAERGAADGRGRDEWGDPIHEPPARPGHGDDRPGLVTIVLPDDGSALG